MYVCMYVCMYVRTYICIYVSTYVCMYVRKYVCKYVCMYACMHVCMYVMYVCMYICISTLDLAEAFPFFPAAVVVVVGSATSLGDCLLGAVLDAGALLLGGGAVGLCFSSNPTTTCLEEG